MPRASRKTPKLYKGMYATKNPADLPRLLQELDVAFDEQERHDGIVSGLIVGELKDVKKFFMLEFLCTEGYVRRWVKPY